MADDLLRLRSIRVREVEEHADGYYVVSAETEARRVACPVCHAASVHGHGRLEQRYPDIPIHGRHVLIVLDRRRYLCNACGKTFLEPVPDLDVKRLMTVRLVEYVRTRCRQVTFAKLARDVGVDDQTIRNIFQDHVAVLRATTHFVTPEVLGLDEVKVIGRSRAVLTNIERRTLFDLLEDRNKKTLIRYFNELPDRHRVRCLVMDMWSVYRQVADTCFRGVPVVIDRFHVERMANDALERVRKAVRKRLTVRQRLKLKDDRHLLLAAFARLTPIQQRTCQEWFRTYPILGHAHAAKERFAEIYQAPSRVAAEALFDRWATRLEVDVQPYFRELLQAVGNRRVDVFNYFDFPITNAYTESVNNLIKLENRMGRGYSFAVLRARMLYDVSARKDGSTSVRRRATVPIRPRRPPGGLFDYAGGTVGPPRTRVVHVKEIVEYGPYIPTLIRLLESGYFE